ncbi:hypothetical protein, partial [Xanthomonas campestris]|uniref:hypothetical protein n=1 Tax=Xanthomonas campestris TaxID=339 RepID=UPI001EDE0D34
MPQQRNDLVEQRDQAAPHQIKLLVRLILQAHGAVGTAQQHRATATATASAACRSINPSARQRMNTFDLATKRPGTTIIDAKQPARIQTPLPFVTSNSHRPRRIVLRNRPHPTPPQVTQCIG